MRLQILSLSLALAAGAAFAQPINENPPTTTIQCIEVGGQIIPPVCRVPGSRLDLREDICTCPAGGQRVDVAICAKGQQPPPESRKMNVARREAVRDGSLIGDTFEGQPICVEPRRP